MIHHLRRFAPPLLILTVLALAACGPQSGKLDRGLIITFSVVAFWLIVAGLIARYWVATGHTFPYLAP